LFWRDARPRITYIDCTGQIGAGNGCLSRMATDGQKVWCEARMREAKLA
jgi:hypothetical protein